MASIVTKIVLRSDFFYYTTQIYIKLWYLLMILFFACQYEDPIVRFLDQELKINQSLIQESRGTQ